MEALEALSSLHCEVKIMSAKNIQETNSKGFLFVRCYLSAGKNKRVRLESREISLDDKLSWNQSFSLDCLATKQSMDMLVQGTVVFELWWRRDTIPLFGRIIGGGGGGGGGSRLLGRAEVSWRSVFESPDMETERWVVMKSKKDVIKAPSIHIAMKIQVPSIVQLVERKKKDDVKRLKNKWDESCGCSHGHGCQSSCLDNEIFAIGAALDAF